MTALLPESIFNTAKTDYEKPSLFLGQTPGLFDTIHKNYPKIWSLYKGMKSLDWDENEFNYAACASDFVTAPKSKVDKMIKSLAWQWEADSVASRAIGPIISLFDPCPELWAAWQRVSDNECLVDGSEVLTPTGWIDLADVNKDTLVAQYDPATGEVEFVNPTDFIEKHYSGIVYEFRNHQKHFHQIVTPGHRMLRRKLKTGEFDVLLAKDLDYRKGAADAKIAGVVAGNIKSECDTPLSDLERLLIAVQADGHVSKRYDGSKVGTIPVWFGFSKARKIERLQGLAIKLGFELTELTGTEARGNVAAKRNFKINIPVEYAPYLKNFNWVNLEGKGYTWCKEFLAEIIEWDGHFTKNTGILHTTNIQAVEVCQSVAALCGMKTHLQYKPDNRKDSFSACWRLSWKEQPFVSGQGIVKSEVEYDGIVRCITVPSGFFLTRYKGSVSVTGNCVHAATYSEIVRMSFPNGNEVLHEILEITEAMQRLSTVAREMAWVRERGLKYQLGLVENDQETYNAIFMFVFLLFVLERVQFMASFAVTFALGQEDLFTQVAKGVQKIATDENEIHVELDREVLAHELTTARGKEAYKQLKPRMEAVFNEVITSELKWTKFLFEDGESLDYLTHAQLIQWVYFSATNVAVPLGLSMDTPKVEANPLHYMKTWLNISDFQASPQSEANGQYKVNLLQRDDDDVEFAINF